MSCQFTALSYSITFLSPEQKLVAICVADNTPPEGCFCLPDMEHIAEFAQTSIECAVTAFRELIEVGLVSELPGERRACMEWDVAALHLLSERRACLTRDRAGRPMFMCARADLDDEVARQIRLHEDRRIAAVLRQKQRIPRWLRNLVLKRDNHTCTKCGSMVGLQVDHIYPESKGGTLAVDNLQTLCMPCNARKGARVE